MIKFVICSCKKLSKPVLGFASGSSMIEKQSKVSQTIKKIKKKQKQTTKQTLNFSVRPLNLQPDIF